MVAWAVNEEHHVHHAQKWVRWVAKNPPKDRLTSYADWDSMSVWELRTRIQQHSVNCGGQGFSLSFSLPSRYSTQDIALVLQHECIVLTRVFVCVFNCDPCTPPPSLPTAGPGTVLDLDDTFRSIDGAAESSNLEDAATLRAHTISARDALLAASGWTEREGAYQDIPFSPGVLEGNGTQGARSRKRKKPLH